MKHEHEYEIQTDAGTDIIMAESMSCALDEAERRIRRGAWAPGDEYIVRAFELDGLGDVARQDHRIVRW